MSISNYFVSDEFLDCLKPISNIIENDVTALEYIIGVGLNYSILFRDGDNLCTEGLSEFVSNVVGLMLASRCFNFNKINNFIYSLYEDKVYDMFNINEDDFYGENKSRLSRFLVHQIIEGNYKFHAFNSAFFESIKEFGINPDVKFISQDELDSIDKIFVDHGIEMILGWQKINCNGKCYYSMTPLISYYYGLCSPEWFARFTGMSDNYDNNDKYNKNSFISDDYESAKNNLLTLMIDNRFSKDDIVTVLDFFDKCWNVYANNSSILAVIPSVYSNDINAIINTLNYNHHFDNDLGSMIKYCYPRHEDDCSTSDVIDVSNAIFIEFPKYSEVLNKLKSSDYKKLVK